MFVNKDFRNGFLLLLLIFLTEILLCYIFPNAIFLLIIIGMFLGLGVYSLSYRSIYMKLRALSELLRVVQQNVLKMDLNVQESGEIGVLRSEMYKVILKLQIQTELLEKDKYYLSNSISDISHQLKTPLTSMNVMVDLLKDVSLPAEKRMQFTVSIKKQLDRIEWLVSSLLIMSKIDAGAIIMKKEPVILSLLLEQASSHLLIPMDLKNVVLQTNFSDTSLSYLGDLKWSSEAISNILKNCLEHSHSGSSIHVACTQNPVYTMISIKDHGDGIAPEDISHIFERFYKGKSASTDSVGIGLALAKKLIIEQNGTLSVKSTPGEGSEFTIKFYNKTI